MLLPRYDSLHCHARKRPKLFCCYACLFCLGHSTQRNCSILVRVTSRVCLYACAKARSWQVLEETARRLEPRWVLHLRFFVVVTMHTFDHQDDAVQLRGRWPIGHDHGLHRHQQCDRNVCQAPSLQFTYVYLLVLLKSRPATVETSEFKQMSFLMNPGTLTMARNHRVGTFPSHVRSTGKHNRVQS